MENQGLSLAIIICFLIVPIINKILLNTFKNKL